MSTVLDLLFIIIEILKVVSNHLLILQPVRAELIQSLWQTLQNPSENDNNAKTAFRVLGYQLCINFIIKHNKFLTGCVGLQYQNNT